MRSSASGAPESACFSPISQRITAKDSRDSAKFSQPPLVWSSGNNSVTIHSTADVGFREVIA